jgi:glycerol dehydrogenase-like iron-containing ADH family enzyme
MGLAEKRLAEKIKVEEFAPFITELHQITGSNIAVEINWDTFIAYDEYSLTRMKSNIFEVIIDAFKHICQDQLGKDAVAEGVSTIKIANSDDLEKLHFSFENKVVEVVVALGGGTYSCWGSGDYIKKIEEKL